MLITCLKCNRHVETGDSQEGDIITCQCGMGILVPEIPKSAGKMNCPACGAPVDPDLRACNFCDTRLATVICPACFGTVFDGSKHCPHCGETLSDRKVIHHGDQTEHACPRCGESETMRVEVVAGFPLERCDKCEGLWVDRETVERIFEDRESAPTIQAQTKSSRPSGPAPGDSGEFLAQGYIKCPDCQKLMNRKNFGRISGVIIDICKDHGTWFDADELRRISEFITSGGLTKAAERERFELKEEVRWLKQKRRIEATREAMQVDHGAHMGMGRFGAEGAALGLVGRLLKGLFD